MKNESASLHEFPLGLLILEKQHHAEKFGIEFLEFQPQRFFNPMQINPNVYWDYTKHAYVDMNDFK